MVIGYKDKSKKFHPIRNKRSPSKNDRKKRFENAKIQSLIFNKKKFSMSEAKEWATDHGFKAVKVEPTKNTFRIRQFSPNKIKRGTECKTIQFGGSGVQGVLCDIPERFKRDSKPLNVKDPLEETNTARRKDAMLMKLSDPDKAILSESEVNWMKKFINNSFGMAKVTDEDFKEKLLDRIASSDGFRISPELNQKGLNFLKKPAIFKSELSARERAIVEDFDEFHFEGFENASSNFALNFQPIWRVLGKPNEIKQRPAFEYVFAEGKIRLR